MLTNSVHPGALRLMLSLLLVFTGIFNGISQIPTVSSGKILRYENFKSGYVAARNVDVWLPKDYSSRRKYAVLYMHDAQMLFDSTITWNKQEWRVDETMSGLMKQKKIRNSIVVAIWNTGKNRHSEYFPQKPFDALPAPFRDSMLNAAMKNRETALFATPVTSDEYLKFLVLELKPFIDSKYSTLPDRDNTFIAGSSMGGLISMYAICEYPAIFGGAACLSTHWPGIIEMKDNPVPIAFLDYLRRYLPDPLTHKIYFDYGTATLDAQYERYQLQVDGIMQQKGYTNQNWKSLKFEGADHSEKAWQARLHLPFEFLLKK